MKKFISAIISFVLLINMVTAGVYAAANELTVVWPDTIASKQEITLSGTSLIKHDLVIRVFDSNERLVFIDAVVPEELEPVSGGGYEYTARTFTLPEEIYAGTYTYTAVVSDGDGNMISAEKSYKVANNNTSDTSNSGRPGPRPETVEGKPTTWNDDEQDIIKETEKAENIEDAKETINNITENTKLEEEELDTSQKEELSQKVTGTIETVSSNIAKGSIVPDSSNAIWISEESLDSESISQVSSNISELTKTAESGGITFNREAMSEYIIEADFSDRTRSSINISKDALNALAGIDVITVKTPSMNISYETSEIREMLEEKDSVEIAVEPAEKDEGGTVKTVNITFDNETTNVMKVSFPSIEGNTDYMSVVDADGNPVGGKYNPFTGCIEAKITEAGVYSVINNEIDFEDIKNETDEIQEAIKTLAAKGIIEGTSETEFSPDDSISRAEIAALILRILAKNDPNEDGGFDDVGIANWYFGVAGSSRKYGLFLGYDDNTFRGDEVIDTEQIVAVAARVLRTEMKYKTPKVEDYITYADKEDISDWALEDVALGTMADIVIRRSDHTFRPMSDMTRGDASLIIKKMFDKIW